MATVDGYMALLREKAATVDSTQRFYLGMFDEDLRNLEDDLDAEGKNRDLYREITAEYQRWLAELTDEQRRQLQAHNSQWNSARQRPFRVTKVVGERWSADGPGHLRVRLTNASFTELLNMAEDDRRQHPERYETGESGSDHVEA